MRDVGDAGVDFKGGEQGCGAVTLILEALPSQGAAVGEAEPTLGALQHLNGRLLVHADHQRILRRGQIQAHDIRRLFCELRVGADAPAPTALQRDTVLTEHPPDLRFRHISQCLRHQTAVPGRIAIGRRPIQNGQDAPRRVLAVYGRLARARTVAETAEPGPAKAGAPLADRCRPQAHLRGDVLGRLSRCRCQDNTGSLSEALLGGPFARPGGELGTFLFR